MGLRATPLAVEHARMGARMTEFAGWQMPLQYSGILAEARAVRSGAGLFDISHMGRLFVEGAGAVDLLSRETVNNVAGLAVGRGHYTLILNERGGIVDDLTVFRLDEAEYLVVTNAVNVGRVFSRLEARARNCTVWDRTGLQAMLALQGPAAADALRHVGGEDAAALPFFAAGRFSISGVECIVSRSGYTGEDGFELICRQEQAVTLWNALLANAEVVPCGLGARDVLRIEAGYPLYGHEIHEDVTPFEAGLAWVLKNPSEFTGRGALADLASPLRRLTGLRAETRSVPRSGDVLEHDGQEVGTVTSGTFSPNLQAAIAMGYLPLSLLAEGTRVTVRSGTKSQGAVVTGLPFGDFGRAKRRKGH